MWHNSFRRKCYFVYFAELRRSQIYAVREFLSRDSELRRCCFGSSWSEVRNDELLPLVKYSINNTWLIVVCLATNQNTQDNCMVRGWQIVQTTAMGWRERTIEENCKLTDPMILGIYPGFATWALLPHWKHIERRLGSSLMDLQGCAH